MLKIIQSLHDGWGEEWADIKEGAGSLAVIPRYGAPLYKLSFDEAERKAILKFRCSEMTEEPLDTSFEVTGTFTWNGAEVPFRGSDLIEKVLP